MAYIGISQLIEAEMNDHRYFSYFYGPITKVYNSKSDDVTFSLRKSEELRCQQLTYQLAMHIVMVKWPEDHRAVDKNKSDCINAFLGPIYKVCFKQGVRLQLVITWDDDQKFEKAIRKGLNEHHDGYSTKFPISSLYRILDDIIHEFNSKRMDKVQWDPEWAMELFDGILNRY